MALPARRADFADWNIWPPTATCGLAHACQSRQSQLKKLIIQRTSGYHARMGVVSSIFARKIVAAALRYYGRDLSIGLSRNG
jgi:hypothetical protein